MNIDLELVASVTLLLQNTTLMLAAVNMDLELVGNITLSPQSITLMFAALNIDLELVYCKCNIVAANYHTDVCSCR